MRVLRQIKAILFHAHSTCFNNDNLIVLYCGSKVRPFQLFTDSDVYYYDSLQVLCFSKCNQSRKHSGGNPVK